jgi:hypothetical protein
MIAQTASSIRQMSAGARRTSRSPAVSIRTVAFATCRTGPGSPECATAECATAPFTTASCRPAVAEVSRCGDGGYSMTSSRPPRGSAAGLEGSSSCWFLVQARDRIVVGEGGGGWPSHERVGPSAPAADPWATRPTPAAAAAGGRPGGERPTGTQLSDHLPTSALAAVWEIGGPTEVEAGCRMRRTPSSRGRPPACSAGS